MRERHSLSLSCPACCKTTKITKNVVEAIILMTEGCLHILTLLV